MMDLSGQRILVIGLGKTGAATARFLSHRGATVTVTDEKPQDELAEVLDQLRRDKVDFRFLPCEPYILSNIDLVIPSPGIPPFHRMLVEAARGNKPILSELELAGRFLERPMIAITGTNGKTTTTTLIGEILAKSGRKVFVGGNIGSPLIGYVDGPQQEDYVVVEVSSFQLQWAHDFQPDVAILLNVTCDHADYHGTFAEYRRVKEKIFANQTDRDLAILNADEDATEALSRRLAADVACFSSTRRLTHGIFLEGSHIVYRPREGKPEFYPLEMIKIPGAHNIENVMAAIAAVRRVGCAPEDILRAVGDFHGIAHRIEYVGERNGVAFYDDSKATNVGAVLRALETFSRPVVLLMGGRDKEGDFEMLSDTIRKKVKTLILFGEARERIGTLLAGVVKTDRAVTMQEAMPMALRYAAAGDVVLLAPGCASFDEFRNYKERGDVFKRWIGSLS